MARIRTGGWLFWGGPKHNTREIQGSAASDFSEDGLLSAAKQQGRALGTGAGGSRRVDLTSTLQWVEFQFFLLLREGCLSHSQNLIPLFISLPEFLGLDYFWKKLFSCNTSGFFQPVSDSLTPTKIVSLTRSSGMD